jgi:uncharacterized protein (TIGR00266 family)
MQFDIQYRPAHSLARVALNPGEAVVAESGAMVGMSTNVQMQTQAGGVVSGLKRLFGGESFFRNTFFVQDGPGEVLLAHALCGDMNVLEMTQAGYYIQGSGYIASTPNVEINTKLGGFKGFLSGAGMFVLQATAPSAGQVLIGAFGGLQELTCDGNMVIDTGHLVAWDATLQYKVGKSGSGWIASFLSGEGLVCHFTGQGRIWIQTRNPAGYGGAMGKVLPPRKR